MHQSVLLKQVVDWLRPVSAEGVLVDATVGLGGHTEALLERYPGARVVAIDRDPAALDASRRRLERFGSRVTFAEGRHEQLIEILTRENIDEVDGVLADLGVSSMQLDTPERGFSFRFDAPLDMRMGASGPTAADLVNSLDEAELAKILREWGEEPQARRIAAAIVHRRAEGPIETTAQLAAVVRSVKKGYREKIDPATLTFQALRIATNEELTGLERFVEDAVSRLKPAGRIAIIAFHSLEDRIVKRTFRRLGGECVCPPGMPVCGCGAVAVIEVARGGAVQASEEEIEANPRARSARLRLAEKKQ